jgi:hypothetical protein
MQETLSKMLTQADLVAALRGRGYGGISERTIAEWRRCKLLPDFDRKGPGRGRGAGRQPGVWVNDESVVNRAAWVSDLLRVYGRIEDAYLPLWMLGYSVSRRQVKRALKAPFGAISASIREEIRGEEDLGFEDLIDHAVFETRRNASKGGLGGFQVSPILMSIFNNLFFNPEYDLEDEPFRRTVRAFELREARRRGRPRTSDDDDVANLFQCAPFIKEHLSFDKLNEVLRHCTDEDLRAVERDLGVLREIVHHGRRMLKAFLSAVPAEYTESLRDSWHTLFTVGRICVLADLSLRRSGYGDQIDRILPEALNHVRAFCNEDRERELRAASKQVIPVLQAKMEEWARELARNAAPALERSLL